MFPGRVGGAETYVRGLVAAYRDGYGPEECVLLAGSQNRSSLEPLLGPSVEIDEIEAYRPGNSNLTRLVAMLHARIRPARLRSSIPPDIDLIHYPVTVPIPDAGELPRVVSLFDIQHHDLPQLFSPAERRFRRWAYDGAAQKADEVITITEFSAGRIAGQLGIPRERVHAIHLGIDHARFTPHGPPPKINGLPERFILYPANAWPHKNHKVLLEAFAQVSDKNLWLVLTGQGEGFPTAERVKWLGHVPGDQLAPLYRSAEALVFPSLYEGFGLPPLEAMACGCPVAASDVGAIAEVCGDAAILFDPEKPAAIAEAIEMVTGNPGERTRLRELGLARAAEFTWEKTAREHVHVYEKGLARRSYAS